MKSNLLKRKKDANKNDFGHVLVIGGDYGMGGAAIMAAESAVKSGAGRVSVLTRNCHLSALLARCPNVMTIDENNISDKIFDNKNVIVIGCGLGLSAWSKRLFKLAMKCNLPKIIDADALNLIAQSKSKFDLKNSIITPHVGEAARLLGVEVLEIKKDRLKAVKDLYKKFGAISVLKESGTLVFDGKEIYKCNFGNPGMAVAGMGDVLSGVIAGFVAQKIGLEEAAIFGVEIHAIAGDLAAKKHGEIGLSPIDLIGYVREAIGVSP